MSRYIPQLDWKAYFAKFSELHGPPLNWKGWLLFPDGWRYSATSHQGPEKAPEDETEARALMAVYWKLRLASVSKEHRHLHAALLGLEQQSRIFSAPLQMRTTVEKEIKNEFGESVKVTVNGDSCDLDLEGLRSRIRDLTEDILQCTQVLQDLTEKDTNVTPTILERERSQP